MDSDFHKPAFGKFTYPNHGDKPLLIYGIGELARIALKVIDAREIGSSELPEDYYIFVAFSGVSLSYPRSNKVTELARLGFTLPSYVSSYAFIASDARIGSNVMIFEHNTIQSEVTIEDSTIVWSGNHIGHQTSIGIGCFISSHVCIGGRTKVGNNSYFGMNSTVRDQLTIGPNSVIGSNSYVSKNFPGNGVAFGNPAKLVPDWKITPSML